MRSAIVAGWAMPNPNPKSVAEIYNFKKAKYERAKEIPPVCYFFDVITRVIDNSTPELQIIDTPDIVEK
jgi:hypothetical protein